MACSQNFAERLTRQLQCEVCCNDFDNVNFIPKLIPCGHTLCVRCLEGLMKAEPASRGVKILQCPKRCKSFPVPREGARGFMTVRDLLVIRDLHMEMEEQRAKTSDNCEIHGIPQKYYCRECCTQICSECALEGHSTHAGSVAKYDDVFGDCKESLLGAVQRGKQTHQETRGLLHAMREVATLLRQAEARLQADVDDLEKLLAAAETATEARHISKMGEITEAISPIVDVREADNASLNNCRFRRIMLILKSLAQNDPQRTVIKYENSPGSPYDDEPTLNESLTEEEKPSDTSNNTVFNEDSTMKQKQVYTTKTTSDTREPFNAYMIMDENDNMFCTDNFNNKLKCFSPNGNCYYEANRIGQVENIRLRNPLGVGLVPGQNSIALLDGDLNDCYLLSKEDFTMKNHFQVLNCRGLACFPSSLVITTTTARVHVMDIETSTVINTLERDSNGKQIFHCPYYVCSQPNTENVVISDTVHGLAAVRLMDTRTGTIVQTYQGAKLKSPKGVSYDACGQLLVADDDRNTVTLLSRDLQFITDLVTAESGVVEPIAASVNSKSQLVVSEKKGKLKLYELLS